MIAKDLFLPKSFSAMRMRIFRDHESGPAGYPGGYRCEGGRFPRLATPETVSVAEPLRSYPVVTAAPTAVASLFTEYRT